MTDTGPSDAALRRWPRWKGIMLVVSLALNLLVVGIVATAAVRHHLAPPGFSPPPTVVTFARSLPEPRRREIWEATRSERHALRPHRAELKQARADVRSALVAEPFDAERFKSAHQRLFEAEMGARKVANQLFEATTMRMTPDERRAFARWQPFAERPPWRRRSYQEQDADGETGGAAQKPAAAATPTGAPETK